MAVEVTPRAKQLSKHAIPVVMIMAALMALSFISVSRGGLDRQTQTLALKKLVARIVRVQPGTNGLAKISLNGSDAASTNPPAGTLLNNGLAQTGNTAQLSIKLDSR